jgi:hypothetical protein
MAVPTPISPALEPGRFASAPNLGAQNLVRLWRVLHLSREVREIVPVLELQLAAGMRPMAFTLSGAVTPAICLRDARGTRSGSLLNAWREVRAWRRWITECDGRFEIVHAHSFSAGMAAARAGAPLVYDIRAFVDEGAGTETAGPSWLARSFRTAEQFALQRAAAVIVHSSASYRGALERGVVSANLFVLPQLGCAPDAELEPAWLRSLAIRYDAIYGYVLSRVKSGRGPLLPPRWQPLAACF